MRPPLLFIHGMWSTPATFDRVRAALASEGWECHAPALPFHDRDPALPPPEALGGIGLDHYVQFLVDYAGRLAAPPVIIGHSMGGLLAQAVALRVVHAGLVLLSTAAAAGIPAIALSPLRTLAGIVSRWGWWENATRIEPAPARWGIFNGVPDTVADAEIRALTWDSGRVLAEMIVPALSRSRAGTIDHRALKAPALVVVGADDRITPPGISRETARRLGGRVDFHEFSGTGHWLFHGEAEQRLVRTLSAWLSQLPG
jgi:pimeloyl-ACP methyl ester carboxylesterase